MNPRDPYARLRDQVKERLVENDRIIVEARMLPKNRKLTRYETESVRSRLRKMMEDTEGTDDPVTLTALADQIDYKPSTLSQWLADKYKGKVDKVTHSVNLWLEREARRRVSKSTREYVPTWVCELMMQAARAAHRLERMAAIVAPSGAGKDMVIDYLAEELNGYVVNCNSKMTGTALVRTIFTKVGMPQKRRGSAEMIDRLCEELRNKNCTLILNEAQNLPPEAAGIVRAIHDETKVPVLMFGSAKIFEFIDDRASGGGQFHRRCKKLNIVDRMAREAHPDDPNRIGRPLYSVEEIREFVRMKQIKLADDDVLAMVWSVANLLDWGALGFANAVLEGIVDAWGRDEVVSCDHFVAQVLDEAADEADDILAQAEAIERPQSLRQMTA
ncbi:AAA family ATPase [Algisphaera agarilytica]|uniref:DNA transposition AAA+ family ATPase n=1 Tax=Algisphaera agarilytica TaxID=1385975 RepID=A0A7X0LJC7_9BACT|nr:AAA family ATPase [Algisphaera agarilytica]MBB6429195.1 DNA transposition AAA+ family ATPase [Algisphaera agarilytica]